MPVPPLSPRAGHAIRIVAVLLTLHCAGAAAQESGSREIRLSVEASAGADPARPLAVGARPVFTVVVENRSARPIGPLALRAQFDSMTAVEHKEWRAEGGALAGTVARLAPGTRIERTFRLRVENAPLTPIGSRVRVEASGPDGVAARAQTEVVRADCVGAYRIRLDALRSGLSQAVRDAAEATRWPDASLPDGRQFPATGARTGELAAAERFAAAFAAERGADPQMDTEWFRFLITRWTSELNAFAGQSANPGLCASAYYQIAGYREGLLPITRRIDDIRRTALHALGAAREAAKAGDGDGPATIARALAGRAGLNPDGAEADPLALLAAARASLGREQRLEGDLAHAFSLAETAAWLAEAERRGQALMQAIEQALATIAGAQKESCVCAN